MTTADWIKTTADWIKRRRELLDAATPGPWEPGETQRYHDGRYHVSYSEVEPSGLRSCRRRPDRRRPHLAAPRPRRAGGRAGGAPRAWIGGHVWGRGRALSLDVRDAIETALGGES